MLDRLFSSNCIHLSCCVTFQGQFLSLLVLSGLHLLDCFGHRTFSVFGIRFTCSLHHRHVFFLEAPVQREVERVVSDQIVFQESSKVKFGPRGSEHWTCLRWRGVVKISVIIFLKPNYVQCKQLIKCKQHSDLLEAHNTTRHLPDR